MGPRDHRPSRITYYSLVSCPLLLKSLSAVSWQRIGCVLTAYWTGAKFATNEIQGMTHTLRYSVYGWPGDSNIRSFGGPNYCKIQCNRYWLQPFVKNLLAYRVRIERAHNAYRTFFHTGFPVIAYRAKHNAYRTRIELRIATLSMISCVSKSAYRNCVSRRAYLRLVSSRC